MFSPLKSYTLPDRKSQGWFASKRKYDVHTGIDLYCKFGDPVFAIEDGTVTNVCHFTGERAGSDWWNNTDAILIKGESGVILYGELIPLVKIGDKIKAGDNIGHILRVLKKNKGNPMDMLHLELYQSDYIGDGEVWKLDENKPDKLKDPSELLQLRFNFDANSYSEAERYIKNRNIQLLKYGVCFKSISKIPTWLGEVGIDAKYYYNGEYYHAIYIYKDFRGMGIYEKYVKDQNYKIITHVDCELIDYLKSREIPFIYFAEVETMLEYKIIQDFYGSKKTKRSDVYLMNHIDEGLRILEEIGASDTAKKAYCLHPIFQSDEELLKTYSNFNFKISTDVLIAVMEYRSVANEYLSKRKIDSIDEIRLSPLKDVNDMLIADKVQNYKDFEIYHKGSHPRSKELDEYFKNWLSRLEIDEEKYRHLTDM